MIRSVLWYWVSLLFALPSFGQDTLYDARNNQYFLNILSLDSTFILDIKYATEENFTNQVMYDCGKCYLKEEVAKALVKAHQFLKNQGLRIKLFDCYRPQSVQYKLWEAVPDPHYVARPHIGSVHNRGGAVDLTLTLLSGFELAMGTEYDYFGEKAHHAYQKLPKNVLIHRQLLKQTMIEFGFSPIRTEWWHYDFKGSKNYPVVDIPWDCE